MPGHLMFVMKFSLENEKNAFIKETLLNEVLISLKKQ